MMPKSGLLTRLAARLVVQGLHWQLGSAARRMLRFGWIALGLAFGLAAVRIYAAGVDAPLVAFWAHWPSLLLAGLGALGLYIGTRFRKLVDGLATATEGYAGRVAALGDARGPER
ncbi:hypothetical protein OU426_02580 [Frigidibacter sp. RF13]|uniref:hypothetical protein n=1 Tax=Frigidibacter sp. RF13 TaxID=2997340 RepID=UPI0022709B8B|nr:hypothetical protein [Frigidibacter sp. RF13]MCY1125729.1 hypothetical protein [Frigidibacter sp. RF13]